MYTGHALLVFYKIVYLGWTQEDNHLFLYIPLEAKMSLSPPYYAKNPTPSVAALRLSFSLSPSSGRL